MNAHSTHQRIAGTPSTQPLLSSVSDDKDDEPPGSSPLSELERHQLTVTTREKELAAISGIGSTLGNVGFVSSAVQFAVTPAAQVGMGVTLGVGASVCMISLLSVFSILLTIPLSYYAYEDYMIESNALELDIKKEEAIRKQHREDLFCALLQLRCMLSEADFFACLATLDIETNEAKKDSLVHLVNCIYQHDGFKTRHYHFYNDTDLRESKENDPHIQRTLHDVFSDAALAQSDSVRRQALEEFRRIDPNFDVHLDRCYKPIEELPTHYFKPFMYGVTGALMFASGLFGTYWTFAGIVAGAGLCAAIPIVGWTLMAVGCVIASIALGVWVAKSKNKNMQREALEARVEERNHSLVKTKEVIGKACLKQYISHADHKLHAALSQEQTKKIRAEVEAKADLRVQQERELRLKAEDKLKKLEFAKSNVILFKQPQMDKSANPPVAKLERRRSF